MLSQHNESQDQDIHELDDNDTLKASDEEQQLDVPQSEDNPQNDFSVNEHASETDDESDQG